MKKTNGTETEKGAGSRIVSDAAYCGYTRTDLACERGRANGEREERHIPCADGGELAVERCREEDVRYVTVSCGRITERSESGLKTLIEVLTEELRRLCTLSVGRPPDSDLRVLVAGLGNADMTADAIGPGTVRRMTATRHLRAYDGEMYTALGCCELSAVAPGVLGQTGIESVELVKGAVEHVEPHLVVAVDALAARSCARLASTFQLSDGGIGPGSGIGNHRAPLDRTSLGCPVLALGVPTVVDSSTLIYDALGQAGIGDEEISDELRAVLENGRGFVVSPRDSDRITELVCGVLAGALDRAFGVGEL